jgi:hypothetical protein
MPRDGEAERFKIDVPFEDAITHLLKGVDTDGDGEGDDGEPDED